MKKNIYLILILILLFSCKNNDNNVLVVNKYFDEKIYTNYLNKEDIIIDSLTIHKSIEKEFYRLKYDSIKYNAGIFTLKLHLNSTKQISICGFVTKELVVYRLLDKYYTEKDRYIIVSNLKNNTRMLFFRDILRNQLISGGYKINQKFEIEKVCYVCIDERKNNIANYNYCIKSFKSDSIRKTLIQTNSTNYKLLISKIDSILVTDNYLNSINCGSHPNNKNQNQNLNIFYLLSNEIEPFLTEICNCYPLNSSGENK